MGKKRINIQEFDEQTAQHIRVEFGAQGSRALDFLDSASALLKSDLDFPKKGEVISYSIREALKSLLDTQAPEVRRKEGNTVGWKVRSREVVEAHRIWLDSKSDPQDVREANLSDLSTTIRSMAEIHDQDDLNKKRLIAVLVDRTGNVPSKEGLKIVAKYSDMIDDANSSLHTEVTLEDAKKLWEDARSLLTTLFMPRERRNEQLETLARLPKPDESNLTELKQLVFVPGYLSKFLGLLTSPAWLSLLETSGLLNPPNVQSWWVGHTMVKALKDNYPNEVLSTLENLLITSTKDPQIVYTIAWAANELGLKGRDLLLKCLRLLPNQIGFIAIQAVEYSNSSDPYVQSIADIIFNHDTLKNENYPDPLFKAFHTGVTSANYIERIKLLVQKIKKIPEDDHWSYLIYDHGVSVAEDGEFHTHETGHKLVHLLTQVLDASLLFIDLSEVLAIIEVLPGDVLERIRPWLLMRSNTATNEQLLDEITVSLSSRRPTVDDIELVEKTKSQILQDEFNTELRTAYSTPPTAKRIADAIKADKIPRSWIYVYSWSPLFPKDVLGQWSDALNFLETRYGEATIEKIQTKMFGEFTSVESPMSIKDIASKTFDEILELARDWRPGPDDWRASASDLAESIAVVMKTDLSVWTANPVEIAKKLVHPTYINRYIRLLTEELDNYEWSAEKLAQLAELVFSEPWEIVPIGSSGRFDYDDSWQWTKSSILRMLDQLARKDANFGTKTDNLVQRLIESSLKIEPDYTPSERDPYERAINHDPTEAFQTLISIAANDFRVNGSVRPAITNHFSAVLGLTGPVAEEIRSLFATNLPLLNGIAKAWLDVNLELIFTDHTGGDLGQTAIDTAMKWGQSSSVLLEKFGKEVWNAVGRNVERSIEKVMLAMLWGTKGYSVTDVVRHLKALGKLSDAGESLARLIHNSSEIKQPVLDIAVEFWLTSIDARSEPLTGFGWFSLATQFSDGRLAELFRKTLEAMDESLDASYQVSKRLEKALVSEEILRVFDLMVRRQSHSFDQRVIYESAVTTIKAASELRETDAYKRLRNALQERDLI